MKKRKIVSILLVAGMLAAMVTGCGGKELTADGGKEVSTAESSQGETAAGSGKKEAANEIVSIMGWYDEDDMEGVINAVNEQLAGEYTLEYTFVALSDYNNVLSTQLASGEGPDIILDGSQYPARIKAGNVEDITNKEYVKEFSEAGLSLSMNEGKIYGIPSYGWFSGIWFNQDILSACEVEVPQNFDEFVAACEKIQAAGYKAMGFGLADGDTAHSSLQGYLENSFYHNNPNNPDGIDFDAKFAAGEVTLDGNINDSVKKWCTLIEKGIINSEMLGISNQDALNSFKAGEVAFFNGGPWQYNEIKETGISFGLMPQLSESGADVFTGGGPAASLGINVNAANKDGAEKALEAFASVEVQQAFVDANPGSPSYRTGVETALPEEYADIAECVEAGNMAANWDRWSVNMPSGTMIDESMALVQGLVSGDMTADEYVKAMDAKADSIRYE